MEYLREIIRYFIRLLVLYLFYILYIFCLNGPMLTQVAFIVLFITYSLFPDLQMDNLLTGIKYEKPKNKIWFVTRMVVSLIINVLLLILLIKRQLPLVVSIYVIDLVIKLVFKQSFTELVLGQKYAN